VYWVGGVVCDSAHVLSMSISGGVDAEISDVSDISEWCAWR